MVEEMHSPGRAHGEVGVERGKDCVLIKREG